MADNTLLKLCWCLRYALALLGVVFVFVLVNSREVLIGGLTQADEAGRTQGDETGGRTQGRDRVRTSFNTTVKRCAPERLKDNVKGGQGGEVTRLVTDFFPDACDGVYLEMGALDGLQYSNTASFQRHRGWKGVLIEPNVELYEKMLVNRPNEIKLFNAAVCAQEGTFHFAPSGGAHGCKGPCGGIVEFMTEEYKKGWGIDKVKTIPVECKPLSALLSEAGVTYIDFFSLDVQDAEFEVLKSLDFSRVHFGVIFTERGSGTKDLKVRTLLQSKGYIHLEHEYDPKQKKHLESMWFISPKFYEIYDGILSR